MEEQFKHGKERSKQQKLAQTEEKLKEILTFLQDYLPLANVHSNDFILHNIWEKYLSKNIRQELEALSDEEALMLPNKLLQYQSEFLNENKTQSECKTKKSTPWSFSSVYLDDAAKVGNHRKLHEVPVSSLGWKHDNIDAFLKDAANSTLSCSGLVSSMEDLESIFRCTDESVKSLVIPNFMTSKKSHEVNTMSDVCSLLAKQHEIDVIVDMGSGKGYLSTQLVYQHQLCVVGVDAQTINTKGAQRRATLLGKQWNALVKQAEELEQNGERKKKGKKFKKRMKKLNTIEQLGEINRNKTVEINLQGQVENETDISEDILSDMQSMLNIDENVCTLKDKPILESSIDEKLCITEEKPNLESNMDKNLCTTEDKPILGSSIDENLFTTEDMLNLESIETLFHSHDDINSVSKDTDLNILLPSINSNQKMIPIVDGKSNSTSNSNEVKLNCDECKLTQEPSSNNDSLKPNDQNSRVCVKEELSNKQSNLYFPVTTYVDDNMDILELVKEAGAYCPHSDETTLMLTGLHTCGLLGTSLQHLFIKSDQTKVLCYVSCCYHLMNEEFVLTPFTDGHEDDQPGFPMSLLLRQHEVGLGRAARNFASQSINRVTTQLQAKSYPRSLLQKILFDIVGYVDDGWKGLRKLDQKCNNMYEYVTRAFEKLKLPTDKITPDLVSQYCGRYKDEERKLAVFLQLKSILAPCIEAVILLDRFCYLLEQECIKDVMLVQMFDPVTSPRCYGIIAYKH